MVRGVSGKIGLSVCSAEAIEGGRTRIPWALWPFALIGDVRGGVRSDSKWGTAEYVLCGNSLDRSHVESGENLIVIHKVPDLCHPFFFLNKTGKAFFYFTLHVFNGLGPLQRSSQQSLGASRRISFLIKIIYRRSMSCKNVEFWNNQLSRVTAEAPTNHK